MPYKFNPFTRQLDYYEPSTGSGGGSSQITNLSVVFYEEFTGDGGTTEFTLTGAIQNAAFDTGSWSVGRVGSALPSHVTDENNSALYDSSNIFTKNRIQVDSIQGITGVVTLTEPPQMLETFRIWYWYTLAQSNILLYYRREEFVASMEGDISGGGDSEFPATSVKLDTTNFDGFFSPSEDTAQKAFDLLDNHEHGSIITDTLIDDIEIQIFYVGHATNNATPADPFWQISKVIETGDLISIYYADGSEDFNKTWNDRHSYTYD